MNVYSKLKVLSFLMQLKEKKTKKNIKKLNNKLIFFNKIRKKQTKTFSLYVYTK
jgi:hypothetical protein